MTRAERRRRQREAKTALRTARAAANACRECSAPRVPGKTRCQRHLDIAAEAARSASARICAVVPPRPVRRRAPARPRVGPDPISRLLAAARKQVARSSAAEVTSSQARRIGDLFERKLRAAGLLQDPAVWSVEDDIREESFSLSFDSAYRRVS